VYYRKGLLFFLIHVPNRRNGESFLKCRFVHRAISAGVETLVRSPSSTMASRVLAGWQVPCLDRGSGTLLRHSAKRASVAGAEGDAGVGMIDLCEEKGFYYVYYVKKADVLGTFWSKAVKSRILRAILRRCRVYHGVGI